MFKVNVVDGMKRLRWFQAVEAAELVASNSVLSIPLCNSQFWTDPTICSRLKPFACIASTFGQLLMSSSDERFCLIHALDDIIELKCWPILFLTFTHFRSHKSTRFATLRNIHTWLLIWILNEFYSQWFQDIISEFSIELGSRG